jgi:hypothetical protein
MDHWAGVADGLATWWRSGQVVAWMDVVDGDVVVRLRLWGCPWGQVVVVFDRPLGRAAVWGRLDDGVDDLWAGTELMGSAYRSFGRVG